MASQGRNQTRRKAVKKKAGRAAIKKSTARKPASKKTAGRTVRKASPARAGKVAVTKKKTGRRESAAAESASSSGIPAGQVHEPRQPAPSSSSTNEPRRQERVADWVPDLVVIGGTLALGALIGYGLGWLLDRGGSEGNDGARAGAENG